MNKNVLKPIEWSQTVKLGITQLVFLLFLTVASKAEQLDQQVGMDQLVSINLVNVPLQQAIKTLEKHTGIRFVYSRNVIDLDRKINLVAKNEKLSTILPRLFPPMQIRYEVLNGSIILSRPVDTIEIQANTKQTIAITAITSEKTADSPERVAITVQGTVTSETDEGLPGVNILLKGTTRGITTDKDGRFSMTVPNVQAILTFTFIGYKEQEIVVGNQTSIAIKLVPDEKSLQEVVVVGYGEQKKVSFTGAESAITTKELIQTPTALLGNALGGRMAGIVTVQRSGEPGYDNPNVWIRGVGTFGSNQSPLFLVDGVERDFNNIDPHEVESFTILKDASATAIFGVRGANGVVLVNTRRGTNSKPKISLTLERGIISPTRLPQYVDGFTYATLYNEANRNAGLPLPYTPEVVQKIKDQSDPIRYPDVNWMKLLKPLAAQSHANLNISGGNPTVRYFVSASYFNDQGFFVEDSRNAYRTNIDRKRYNLRTNVDINLSKEIEMNIGITGISENRNFPGSGTQDIFNLINKATPILYPTVYPDGRIPGTVASQRENPYGRITQTGYQTQFLGTTQGTFGLKYDLNRHVKGLYVRGRFAFDSYSTNNIARRKNFETWLASANDDPATGQPTYGLTAEGDKFLGYAVTSSGERRAYTEASVNYNRTVGRHDLGGLILFNQGDRQLTANSAIGSLPYRRMGLVGRLTYGWAEKYFGEVNFGYNGSENFPRGKRFGFFPALSAGWVISEEPFFKNNIPAINVLKLKGSFGIVGNDQINDQRFLYLTTLASGGNYLFGTEFNNPTTGILESAIGNPNITWETSQKSNIGLEIRAFKDRLTLFVDVFREHRTNILTQRGTVPDLAGIQTLPYANIGIANNQGVDGTLAYRTAIGGLRMDFRGNYTFASNRVVFIDEPKRRYDYLQRTGQRINQPFGLEALGFFKDEEDIKTSPRQTFTSNVSPGDIKYRDTNGDGVIDVYDEKAIGFPNVPQVIYGLSSNFTYKGFDLSFLFQGVGNVSVFRNYQGYIPFSQGQFGNVLTAALDRWTPESPNPNASFPRLYPGNNDNNYRNSTFWQVSGQYIRLKNAQIGYTLPKLFAQRIKTESIRLYANGLNLFLWDRIKHYDPESGDGAGRYPPSRVINFGVNINF